MTRTCCLPSRHGRLGSETCDTQLLQVRKGCTFDGCSVTVGVSELFPPDQGAATRVRDSVGQHRPTRPGSASAPFGPGVLLSSVSPSTAVQTTQPSRSALNEQQLCRSSAYLHRVWAMAPPANEAVGPQQLPDVCRCAQRCGRARHRTRSELLVVATGRLVAASSRRGCITLAKLPEKQSVHSFLLQIALNSEKAHLSHQPSPCPLTEGQVSGQARGCSSLPTAQTRSARSARGQARHTRYMCSCRDMAGGQFRNRK